MSLDDLAFSLSETPLSMALADSPWAFPTVESLHVIAITLVVGSIAVVDLHLIGLARRERAPRLMQRLLPLTWLAFAVAATTGSLLVVANPLSYFPNAFFRVKLGLLGLAALNMLAFHALSQRHLPDPRAVSPRVSGGISLALWIAIVACGRWVGFTL